MGERLPPKESFVSRGGYWWRGLIGPYGRLAGRCWLEGAIVEVLEIDY